MLKAGLLQRGQTVMLDVIPIQISEKFLEPLVHNLVIAPPMLELVEEDRSSLSCLVLKCGEVGKLRRPH